MKLQESPLRSVLAVSISSTAITALVAVAGISATALAAWFTDRK